MTPQQVWKFILACRRASASTGVCAYSYLRADPTVAHLTLRAMPEPQIADERNVWLCTLFSYTNYLTDSRPRQTYPTMYKCKIAEIDIGAMIRRKVDEQHWSYTAFASAICCSRSALYNIFNNRDISVIRLIKISEVLQHDFFKEICGIMPATTDRPSDSFIAIRLHDGRIAVDDLPPQIAELIHREINKCTES